MSYYKLDLVHAEYHKANKDSIIIGCNACLRFIMVMKYQNAQKNIPSKHSGPDQGGRGS